MPNVYIALIRGINVGKAKRVAMADLRRLVENLGYGDVRTLLNSGNVVFTTKRKAATSGIATKIEKALTNKTGISARVTVLDADELNQIAEENSLSEIADNPSRLQIAVPASPPDAALFKSLLERDWQDDALAVGGRAVYMWCPNGLLKSEIPPAVEKLFGEAVTTRNWKTLSKIHDLAQELS